MSKKLEASIFRAVPQALLEQDTSKRELKALARSVHDGRLGIAIADVIYAYAEVCDDVSTGKTRDVESAITSREFTDSNKKSPNRKQSAKAKVNEKNSESDRLFDLAKRRKITRSDLRKLMNQVDRELSEQISDEKSMREWLELFYQGSIADDWTLLEDLISGNVSTDPYLRDILG